MARRILLPGGLLLALALAAAPAAAQHRGGGGHSGGGHAQAAAPAQARTGARPQAARPSGGPVYRSSAVARVPSGSTVVVGHDVRGNIVRQGYAVPRPAYSVRVVQPFYRPYYVFRPHFATPFGLFIGYPVAYPFSYVQVGGYYPYYPYAPYAPYAPYPVYSYPPAAYDVPSYSTVVPSVDSTPAPAVPAGGAFGGVSFNITPADANVYVDGSYAGTTADFTATRAPLTLSVGEHHVDIVSPGYRSMSFDVTITQGQVVPYQGGMEPLQR